jgi:hypothetical protein
LGDFSSCHTFHAHEASHTHLIAAANKEEQKVYLRCAFDLVRFFLYLDGKPSTAPHLAGAHRRSVLWLPPMASSHHTSTNGWIFFALDFDYIPRTSRYADVGWQ